MNYGAVTPSYQINPKHAINILQSVLATEIVCVLRYTMNAVTANGISSESVKKEFDEHAMEKQKHMVAERINDHHLKDDGLIDGLKAGAEESGAGWASSSHTLKPSGVSS
jgi:bacterioferritin